MATEARVLRVCDAWADRLAARLPAATVRVGFVPRYDRKTMSGAYVWIFPVSDREAAKLTRASDQMAPKIAVIYAEKCEEEKDADSPEPVPDQWTRERIKTVETEIFDILRDERTEVVTPPIAGVWPETAEWVTVFDQELLSAERVFWSEVEVEFGFPT